MPWKERDQMSLRTEFVHLARSGGANVAELCRRFRISRKTGYKWLSRFGRAGLSGLVDQPRRPHHSPWQTGPAMEEAVLDLRRRHPTWGGRKIRVRLRTLGHVEVPSASTITAILHRHGCIAEAESTKRGPMQRFERASPNELWQMDFKGDFALGRGGRCYPLTVLDDHSRYSIAVRACGNERRTTVHNELTSVFRIYGLPQAMLMDNGGPWGGTHGRGPGYTRLTAWLLRLDVRVLHGRPYHPQTQGKDERFHRTLKQELLRDRWYGTLADAQRDFDPWRRIYNTERPHEGIDMEVPASRYRPSERPMPLTLPPLEYGQDVASRAVNAVGRIQFKGWRVRVSEAFSGGRIGLRPTSSDGIYHLLWSRFVVGHLDLTTARRGQTVAARLRSLRSLQRTTTDPEATV